MFTCFAILIGSWLAMARDEDGYPTRGTYIGVIVFIFLMALGSGSYLVSDFMIDDTPPPYRITYEYKYGFWADLAAHATVLLGCVITLLVDRKYIKYSR